MSNPFDGEYLVPPTLRQLVYNLPTKDIFVNNTDAYLNKLVIYYRDGSKYVLKHANLTLDEIIKLSGDRLKFTLNKHTDYGSVQENHTVDLKYVKKLVAHDRNGGTFEKKLSSH